MTVEIPEEDLAVLKRMENTSRKRNWKAVIGRIKARTTPAHSTL